MSGDGGDNNDPLANLNRLVGNSDDEKDSALGQIDADVTKKDRDFLARAEGDEDIDDVTKNEFRNRVFREGASNYEQALAYAKSGKGIYGIRRRNVQVAKFMADKPGASQLNLANVGKPVGDTSVAGLPSLISDGDPIGTASLIQQTQIQQEKRRKRGDV